MTASEARILPVLQSHGEIVSYEEHGCFLSFPFILFSYSQTSVCYPLIPQTVPSINHSHRYLTNQPSKYTYSTSENGL
jgi:hypothetical protein